MSAEPEDAPPTFSVSGGATRIVEWLDGILLELRQGRVAGVREALEGARWRVELDVGGIPPEILDETQRRIGLARDALRDPSGSIDAAEQALLMARAHFLPGG